MPLPPGATAPPDAMTAMAVKAWNWMGGVIDWAALPLLADLLGFDDLEMLIVLLDAIRNHQKDAA